MGEGISIVLSIFLFFSFIKGVCLLLKKIIFSNGFEDVSKINEQKKVEYKDYGLNG